MSSGKSKGMGNSVDGERLGNKLFYSMASSFSDISLKIVQIYYGNNLNSLLNKWYRSLTKCYNNINYLKKYLVHIVIITLNFMLI